MEIFQVLSYNVLVRKNLEFPMQAVRAMKLYEFSSFFQRSRKLEFAQENLNFLKQHI